MHGKGHRFANLAKILNKSLLIMHGLCAQKIGLSTHMKHTNTQIHTLTKGSQPTDHSSVDERVRRERERERKITSEWLY